MGPGSVVGALTNEGGLHRSDFGRITIKSDFSLVELPATVLDAVGVRVLGFIAVSLAVVSP